MTKENQNKLRDFAINHLTRNRVTAPEDKRQMTEQMHQKACDINNIVAQFQKTGIMPQATQIPKYLDTTDTPDLIDAFYAVQEAQQGFLDLPANIRRLMDNDPAQIEQFMANPENYDILKKHGILIERPAPKEPEPTLKDVINVLKENKKPTEKL